MMVNALWGESDRITSIENAKRLSQEIPNCKLISIPGGHCAFEENVEKITPMIVQHLRNL